MSKYNIEELEAAKKKYDDAFQRREFPELPRIVGHKFDHSMNLDQFIDGFKGLGIQGSVVYKAINILNRMISWRLEDEPDHDPKDLESFVARRALMYLGWSTSQAYCGNRDIVRYLLEHRMFSVSTTTAGGVEADLMRCFGDFYVIDYDNYDDKQLKDDGYERHGNVILHQDTKTKFKEWFLEEIKKMHSEQDIKNNIAWTPSKIIRRLGLSMNNEKSILTQAALNDVTIYCPALTDGFMGDCLYEYNEKNPGFIIDTSQDFYQMVEESTEAIKTGVFVIGAGITKHQTFMANLLRKRAGEGSNFCVTINTGAEFESSDSGAPLQEGLTWGKLSATCDFIKVHSETSVVLPLIVAGSFKKNFDLASRREEWKAYKAQKGL